ncbi:hypothetical protein QUA56_11830 [Microcoleus sp. N3A4]
MFSLLFLLLGTIVDRVILGKLQDSDGVGAILGDLDLGCGGDRAR